jgi:hypothetical protein
MQLSLHLGNDVKMITWYKFRIQKNIFFTVPPLLMEGNFPVLKLWRSLFISFSSNCNLYTTYC